MYSKIKKTLDKLAAIVLLVLTAPITLICLACIYIEDNSQSPIFKQKRIGYKNQEFFVYKIRTMRSPANGLISDGDRMLKFGEIFRKLSLDELPQLVNILKGEMSFIGPRPLPVIYLPYYTEEELKRHDVLPGISGLAQVSGRNFIDWDEKLKFDRIYVEKFSFILDFKILLITLKKVIKSSDVGVRGKDFVDVSLHEIRNKVR